MNMTKKHILLCIALIEILAMMPWIPPYIALYSNATLTSFGSAVFVFFVALNGVFIISPVASTLCVLRENKIAPYMLSIFPVLAFINGISAIPYLANIAPEGGVRTVALVVVNGGLILTVFLVPRTLERRNA